jgi:hypothetical protein
MTLKKVKGGWVVVHGNKKGQIGKRISATKKPVSYKKALSIHRAISISKARKAGHKIPKRRKK